MRDESINYIVFFHPLFEHKQMHAAIHIFVRRKCDFHEPDYYNKMYSLAMMTNTLGSIQGQESVIVFQTASARNSSLISTVVQYIKNIY